MIAKNATVLGISAHVAFSHAVFEIDLGPVYMEVGDPR